LKFLLNKINFENYISFLNNEPRFLNNTELEISRKIEPKHKNNDIENEDIFHRGKCASSHKRTNFFVIFKKLINL